MTNKERVFAALRFKQADRLPFNIDLTWQMLEKALLSTTGRVFWSKVNNHISV